MRNCACYLVKDIIRFRHLVAIVKVRMRGLDVKDRCTHVSECVTLHSLELMCLYDDAELQHQLWCTLQKGG